ncbi:MAG TPA: ribbon-helix-helix protein, CopG family [Solirubrobacterales bacterium]|nr:ribbon-helix-helix protein, CopG family [Solirubrobacterales bacterium]
MNIKITTLRLAVELADELAAVARADGMPVSEAVREAVGNHIAERRADPDFQDRLKERMEETQAVMKRLAAGGS